MAANDAVSMNVAENRQNVPMAIQENRAAVPMTVAEGGGTPGGLNRKADKVTGAVAGNLAGLDANGNLTDSGKAPGDFLEAPAAAGSEGQVLTADGEGGASWQDPTGGDPTEIIDDTAGDGDTDKVWSADKSHSLLTQINSKADELKSALSDNGERTGIVEPTYILKNFTIGASTFDNTGRAAINGHRYTAVFPSLSNVTTMTFGAISGSSWVGGQSVYGTSKIATFTATGDGIINFRLSSGSSQTASVIYIFDTTGDNSLQSFLEANTFDSATKPYSGMGKYLENRIDRIGEIIDFAEPDDTLTNFAISGSFDDTGFSATNGHRYAVVFTQTDAESQLTIGVISGGAWKGSVLVLGKTGIAMFTAEASGKIYFKRSYGTVSTLAKAYIYDTTSNDYLLAFVSAHKLNSPNVLYDGSVADAFGTWYKMKAFAPFGDSVTYLGEWIPFVNEKFVFGKITNCGVGGTRVSGSDANAFWQDARVETIPTDTDFMTIMGGTNDGQAQASIGTVSRDNYDTDTFVGAYNVLISKILYKFTASGSGYYPNVDYSGITRVSTTKTINILLVTCGFCAKTSAAGTDFSRMEGLANACIEVGKMWGLPVADIYHNAGINPITAGRYLPDEVHPNTEGGKRIASIIIGKMKETEPIT